MSTVWQKSTSAKPSIGLGEDVNPSLPLNRPALESPLAGELSLGWSSGSPAVLSSPDFDSPRSGAGGDGASPPSLPSWKTIVTWWAIDALLWWVIFAWLWKWHWLIHWGHK